MAGLKFLDAFKKSIAKVETINIGLGGPPAWLTTGNYALNRSLSGDFFKGIPLGRLTLFAGPSGAGKSFISSNCMKSAQDQGFHLLVLDSENAIDTDYLQKIGVDTGEDKLTYFQVTTIEDVNKICSEFFTGYVQSYGKNNPDSPRVLLVIDSLAMLSTSTEFENYGKDGTIKADQGIRAKRNKSMLRMLIGQIARLPVAAICTDHVYGADVMLGDGQYAITNSTKFSCSIIGIVTKLKLKEETEVIGVRMRFETYKSRFAKLGTKIELEVPYSSGMSPYSGLVEMLTDMGVLVKDGHSVRCDLPSGESIKFKARNIDADICAKLFTHPICNPVVMEDTNEPELADIPADSTTDDED